MSILPGKLFFDNNADNNLQKSLIVLPSIGSFSQNGIIFFMKLYSNAVGKLRTIE